MEQQESHIKGLIFVTHKHICCQAFGQLAGNCGVVKKICTV